MNAHLRQRLLLGMLCSLPIVAAPMMSLAHSFAPAHQRSFLEAQSADAQIQADSEGYEDTEEPPAHPRLVFFKVVSASLGEARVLPLPPASGSHMSKHDICVTVHKATYFEDDDDRRALVNAEAASASTLSSVVTLNVDNMAEHIAKLQTWKVSETLCAFQHGDAFLYEPVIKSLLEAKALPSTNHYLSIGALDVETCEFLTGFASYGFVLCVYSDEAETRWKLTPLGLSKLCMLDQAQEPLLLFKPPVQEKSVWEKATAWELMVSLQQQGWQLTGAPKTAKQRMALPPYIRNGLKWAFISHKDFALPLR